MNWWEETGRKGKFKEKRGRKEQGRKRKKRKEKDGKGRNVKEIISSCTYSREVDQVLETTKF